MKDIHIKVKKESARLYQEEKKHLKKVCQAEIEKAEFYDSAISYLSLTVKNI